MFGCAVDDHGRKALPPGLPAGDFEAYWAAMSEEFAALGIAVVAGHTGRYAGCDLTIVGAATLVGIGDEGRYKRVGVKCDCESRGYDYGDDLGSAVANRRK